MSLVAYRWCTHELGVRGPWSMLETPNSCVSASCAIWLIFVILPEVCDGFGGASLFDM